MTDPSPAVAAAESAPPPPSQSPPPGTRAEGLLRIAEKLWARLDGLVERFLPANRNPFAQLGAVANTCLLIAVVSGVALLIWYTPSVHQAHASLERLRSGAWLGQWVRSIHRYSSDGCILFILLHAGRIVSQRRLTGARSTAWITGILMLAALWFIGWTGYWLVWDVRAQHAALGSARFIDRIPLFAEPLSRSFLTDASVPSLLFFLIFFAHMLLPLSVGVGLWLHLMRLSRVRLLTNRPLTLWIAGSLAIVSMAFPATSAAPASMTAKVSGFTQDWWYLWPMGLTDRLSGGSLWSFFLLGGLVALSAPWWMSKGRRPPAWKATVDLPRCFGCTLCAKDCPFTAITMVAREDGRKWDVQSQVDPDLCVGCGVCVGACDSQAINLPGLDNRAVERRIQSRIDEALARGEMPFLAYVCGDSGADHLRIAADGTSPELPGFHVERVPCLSWVSAVMLERPLKRGAGGILAIACGTSDAAARDGCRWFEERLEGKREPSFNRDHSDISKVRLVRLSPAERQALPAIASEFRQGIASREPRRIDGGLRGVLAGIVLATLLSAVAWIGSTLPYRTPHSPDPELVVSFNHLGAIATPRQLTQAERANRLPHMRAQINVNRGRVPIQLRVQVDGRTVHDQAYRARGLSQDGPGIGLVTFPVAAGKHEVVVELADTPDAGNWTQRWSGVLEFEDSHRRVVLFDTKSGFSAH